MVVDVIVFRDKIYGLTQEGHLVYFDEETGKWIRRSSGDVIEAGSNEAIKCKFTKEIPSLIVPRASKVDISDLEIPTWKELFVNSSIGLGLLALLGFVLYRFLLS